MFSGICGQRRPRSDCADAQSDLGLLCSLIESLSTVEHNEVQQYDQADLDLFCLHLARRPFTMY